MHRLIRPTLLLPICAALAMAGCGPNNSGETKVVLIGDGARLSDPAAGPVDSDDAVLLSAAAEGLVQLDPRGEVIPGIAERWHVSDDGMSYIFRLGSRRWPDGKQIEAETVARLLRRSMRAPSNRLFDSFRAVEDVKAMTDRVIEIRLSAPRPDLLTILGQPELALLRNGQGAGPFLISRSDDEDDPGMHLSRLTGSEDRGDLTEETIHLSSLKTADAIAAFAKGEAELVLGGTFANLPLALQAEINYSAIRIDPVIGLFGLQVMRADGPLGDKEVRSILNRAIDRDALVADLQVPGLLPRATLLQAGLDVPDGYETPAWSETAIAERRAELGAALRRQFGDNRDGNALMTVRLYIPAGPGGDMVYERIAADWLAVGVATERVQRRDRADVVLVDEVAPSTSASWFVRRFRCGAVPICSTEADELLAEARKALVVDNRQRQLVEAARMMDQAELFMPLTAPIRWSLATPDIRGFAPNILGRHALTGLKSALPSESSR